MKDKAKAPVEIHNFPLRLPEALFRKLENERWKKRTSINALIVEAVKKAVS